VRRLLGALAIVAGTYLAADARAYAKESESYTAFAEGKYLTALKLAETEAAIRTPSFLWAFSPPKVSACGRISASPAISSSMPPRPGMPQRNTTSPSSI
jgi:hypothetical protein